MYSLVVQVVREVAKCVVICNIESRGGAAWFQVGLIVLRLGLYGFFAAMWWFRWSSVCSLSVGSWSGLNFAVLCE